MNFASLNVFAISRRIWDDPDFAPEPFSEREAWIWLIASAAWNDFRTRGNAGSITLKRGEFSFSLRFLAEKWQWKKDRVRRFIARLEKRDTICDSSRDGCLVYSIRNYNKFQIVGVPQSDSERDSPRDADATPPRQLRDKEETKKTNTTIIEDTSSLRSDVCPAAQATAEPASPSQPDLPAKPETAKRQPLSTAEAVALEAYNAVAADAGWPTARHVTAKRRTQIRARLREAGGVEGWQAAMDLARASPFLRGVNGRDRAHADWTPDFDFFLKQDHFTKLMEGKYGGQRGGNSGANDPAGFAAVLAGARAALDRREMELSQGHCG